MLQFAHFQMSSEIGKQNFMKLYRNVLCKVLTKCCFFKELIINPLIKISFQKALECDGFFQTRILLS